MKENQLRDAGRGLDAIVAERVLGWQRGRMFGNGNGEWIIDGDDEDFRTTWDETPRFSTDISAAFQVVEAMREKDYDVRIQTGDDAEWYATFDRHVCHIAHAETLPLAICRAALLAAKWAEDDAAATPHSALPTQG